MSCTNSRHSQMVSTKLTADPSLLIRIRVTRGSHTGEGAPKQHYLHVTENS